MSKKIATAVLLALALSSCKSTDSSDQASAQVAPQKQVQSMTDWVEQSNQIAEQYTRSFSTLYPELGSSLGYREYDKQGRQWTPDLAAQEKALLLQWQSKLESELQHTDTLNLKVDLLILLDQVKTDIKVNQVDEQLGTITFRQASRFVYNNLMRLINEQSPAERKADAVSRFKYYMSEQGKLSLVQGYKKEIAWHLEKYKNQDKFYPFVGEVNKYLSNSAAYVGGVKELLEQSGRNDWQAEFQRFEQQINDYDAYISSEILPKARTTPEYPKAVYQLTLKQVGVEATPESLIIEGNRAFAELYQQFSALAVKIAKNHHLEKTDPASVIGFLKGQQVSTVAQVSELYQGVAEKLEHIIADNHLVTLPNKKLKIRFAGDAESKAAPVPHLIPPPLIDNNGIVPEFVVPTSSSGEMPFDDFSFANAAIVLTAHEGRPGHDLQFSKMLENPVTIVRARYAMNSVNVEGWALWAEDLVFPYLTDEEKLIALQTRLWRVARYFLDPMVQLGQAGQDKVLDVFTNKLGVSSVMAGLEYQRYAFRNPGQATAYYHGYLNIINLKKDLTAEFGELKLQCFNDTLLSFGLLPHKQIRLFKEQFKACAI